MGTRWRTLNLEQRNGTNTFDEISKPFAVRLTHVSYEQVREKTNSLFGFPTRPDTNRPVKSQKKARSLQLCIKVEEQLYYPCSGDKDADQLCSYCTGDLRLCFRVCKLLFFPCSGSYLLSTCAQKGHRWFYQNIIITFMPSKLTSVPLLRILFNHQYILITNKK